MDRFDASKCRNFDRDDDDDDDVSVDVSDDVEVDVLVLVHPVGPTIESMKKSSNAMLVQSNHLR
jgi:hypothetical protein